MIAFNVVDFIWEILTVWRILLGLDKSCCCVPVGRRRSFARLVLIRFWLKWFSSLCWLMPLAELAVFHITSYVSADSKPPYCFLVWPVTFSDVMTFVDSWQHFFAHSCWDHQTVAARHHVIHDDKTCSHVLHHFDVFGYVGLCRFIRHSIMNLALCITGSWWLSFAVFFSFICHAGIDIMLDCSYDSILLLIHLCSRSWLRWALLTIVRVTLGTFLVHVQLCRCVSSNQESLTFYRHYM